MNGYSSRKFRGKVCALALALVMVLSFTIGSGFALEGDASLGTKGIEEGIILAQPVVPTAETPADADTPEEADANTDAPADAESPADADADADKLDAAAEKPDVADADKSDSKKADADAADADKPDTAKKAKAKKPALRATVSSPTTILGTPIDPSTINSASNPFFSVTGTKIKDGLTSGGAKYFIYANGGAEITLNTTAILANSQFSAFTSSSHFYMSYKYNESGTFSASDFEDGKLTISSNAENVNAVYILPSNDSLADIERATGSVPIYKAGFTKPLYIMVDQTNPSWGNTVTATPTTPGNFVDVTPTSATNEKYFISSPGKEITITGSASDPDVTIGSDNIPTGDVSITGSGDSTLSTAQDNSFTETIIIPTPTGTANTEYTYTYTATDQAGNTTDYVVRVLVDLTPPDWDDFDVTETSPGNFVDVTPTSATNEMMLVSKPSASFTLSGEASDSPVSINGNSIPAEDVEITGSGPSYSLPSTVNSFSNEIITIPSGASDGDEYTYTYTATDQAGNASTYTVRVVVDTTSPTWDSFTATPSPGNFVDVTPLSSPPANEKILISSKGKSFTLSGEASDSEVSINNVDYSTGDVAITGSVAVTGTGSTPTYTLSETDDFTDSQITIPSDAADGDVYTYTYTATDKLGNSSTFTVKVLIDNTAPTLTVTPTPSLGNFVDVTIYPTPPATTSEIKLISSPGKTFYVDGEATDPSVSGNSTGDVAIVGSVAVTGTGTVPSYPLSETDDFQNSEIAIPNDAADGDVYTYTYTATDAVGNSSTFTIKVKIDNEGPLVDINGDPDDPDFGLTETVSGEEAMVNLSPASPQTDPDGNVTYDLILDKPGPGKTGTITVTGTLTDEVQWGSPYYPTGKSDITLEDSAGNDIVVDEDDGTFAITINIDENLSDAIANPSSWEYTATDIFGNERKITIKVKDFNDILAPILNGTIIAKQDDTALADLNELISGNSSDRYSDLHATAFGNFFQKMEITVPVKDISDSTNGTLPSGVIRVDLYSAIPDTSDPTINLIESKTVVILEGNPGEAKFTVTLNSANVRPDMQLYLVLHDGRTPLELHNVSSPIQITTENAKINDGATTRDFTHDEFTLDTEAPVITDNIQLFNQSGVDNRDSSDVKLYSNTAPQFSLADPITDNEGLNRVIRKVNGSITDTDTFFSDAVAMKSWQIPTTTVNADATNGKYDFSIDAIDNAGNVADQRTKTVYFDGHAPVDITFSFHPGSHGLPGSEVKNSQAETKIEEFYIDPNEDKPYGYIYKEDTDVTIRAKDANSSSIPGETTSGVKTISVYGVDYSNGKDNPQYVAWHSEKKVGNIDAADIDGITAIKAYNKEDGNGEITITVPKGFKGQIYAKATDWAANPSSFKEPNKGTIVDNVAPSKPVLTFVTQTERRTAAEQGSLPLYDGSVVLGFEIGDSLSGIQNVEWEATAPGQPDKNQSGSFDVDETGAIKNVKNTDVADSGASEKDKNLATQIKGTIDVDKKINSNNITVTLKVTDNAGNTRSASEMFSIDTTRPKIAVTYKPNEGDATYKDYFKTNRVATVTITERNLSAKDIAGYIERELDDGSSATPIAITVPKASADISGLTAKKEYMDKDKTTLSDDTTYTFTVLFDQKKEGDIKWGLGCADLAGNPSSENDRPSISKPDKFTMDFTNPTFRVDYDKKFVSENVYGEVTTATITVEEHNFDPARVVLTQSANDAGTPKASPSITGWSHSGNTHTTTLVYNSDAEYTFDIRVTDKAGRVKDDYAGDTFIVDLTDPEIIIAISGNTSSYQALNLDEIQPTVEYKDTNYTEAGITMSLSAVKLGESESRDPLIGGGVWTQGQDNHGGTYTLNNFPNEKASDAIYHLSATIRDKAGHTKSADFTFSVNRFGSTYEVERGGSSLEPGSYFNDTQAVTVREVNPNYLELEKGFITHGEGSTNSETLFESGKPAKGVSVTQNRGPGSTAAWGGWNTAEYLIPGEVFANEVEHSLFVESIDQATNKNDNKVEKTGVTGTGLLISFTTDMHAPDIIVSPKPPESGEFKEDTELTAEISDNILLDDENPVQIEVGGRALSDNEYYVENSDGQSMTVTFTAPKSTGSYKITAKDKAQNEGTDLFSSGDVPLAGGSNGGSILPWIIGGILLAVALAGLVFFLLKRRRRADDEGAY